MLMSKYLKLSLKEIVKQMMHKFLICSYPQKKQQKEVALVCEEGIYDVKAINNLLIPQSSETLLIKKPQTVPEKT